MANLVADGSPPSVTWDDGGGLSNDWRMQESGGALTLAKDSLSYENMFVWTSTGHTSYKTLTISTTEPQLTFDDTDGSYDVRLRNNAGTFYVDVYSGGAYTTLMDWEVAVVTARTNLRIATTQPTMVWEDTDSSDFKLSANGGTFYLSCDSGFGYVSIAEWTSSQLAVRANVKVSSTSPTILFEETDNATVFQLRANAAKLNLEYDSGSGSTALFEWTSSGVIARQNITVSNATPAISLVDTDSDDFKLKADGGTLSLQVDSGSGFTSIFTWTEDVATALHNVVISNEVPTLTLEDTTSEHPDYRLRVEDGDFNLEVLDEEYRSVLGCDSHYIYAPLGIASGHGVGTGPSHVILWKKFFGTLTQTEVDLGYFTKELTDEDPAEWTGKTYAVNVMMEDATTGMFQAHDWRGPEDVGGFWVQVEYGGGLFGGDIVKVTFDTATYAAGDRWRMLAFYDKV